MTDGFYMLFVYLSKTVVISNGKSSFLCSSVIVSSMYTGNKFNFLIWLIPSLLLKDENLTFIQKTKIKFRFYNHSKINRNGKKTTLKTDFNVSCLPQQVKLVGVTQVVHVLSSDLRMA